MPRATACATRQLWTSDAGHSWHDTRTLSGDFAGSGGRIYFWQRGSLRMLSRLPVHGSGTRLATSTVASVADGTIVSAVPIRGGVAVLVSNRVNGAGWDNAPRVLLAHGSAARNVVFLTTVIDPLVQTIKAAGRRLTVTAVDDVQQPSRTITWTSADGGKTWSAGG
jgi:hypothetical protein